MNKTVLGVLLFVFLIVVIVVASGGTETMNDDMSDADMEEAEATAEDTTTGAAPAPAPQSNSGSPSNSQPTPVQNSATTYEQALAQYGNTRMQFNINCQANPSSLAISNGTTIMLDNRSGDARWISVGGTGYQVSGFGFRLVPVSVANTPQTMTLNCGSAVNVGTIIIN